MGERRLLGEVAIVTGAAHGIGRAIAVELAREGASVWACDVLERELGETRRAVGERSDAPCRTAVVDVTDPRRVAAFVEDLVAAEKRVDVLVNCAGGVVGQTMKPVEEVTDEAWRAIFSVNLDGAFHFTRATVPPMKARRRGSIVNISSGAGRPLLRVGRRPVRDGPDHQRRRRPLDARVTGARPDIPGQRG
jgi:3-oxoacyl-[acyl-carrier protein] reductase